MRAIGEVATMLAHDFRNPLSTIKMNLQILSRRMQPVIAAERRRDAVENREHFDLALTEVGFLEHLLTSMLEFARPGNMAMAWEDAGLLLADICRPFAASLDGENIDFVQRLDQSLVEIYVDREKLKQVLNNLVTNAAQSMPNGGGLTISTQAAECDGMTRLVIEVSDTGCGMSPELQQRIFDPFFTSHSDGTGLGLAIVHKIIEAHGGEVAVVSEPGKGSTFTITVPARQPSGVEEVTAENVEFAPSVQG
jgi:signal transduction histidine kinase